MYTPFFFIHRCGQQWADAGLKLPAMHELKYREYSITARTYLANYLLFTGVDGYKKLIETKK